MSEENATPNGAIKRLGALTLALFVIASLTSAILIKNKVEEALYQVRASGEGAALTKIFEATIDDELAMPVITDDGLKYILTCTSEEVTPE